MCNVSTTATSSMDPVSEASRTVQDPLCATCQEWGMSHIAHVQAIKNATLTREKRECSSDPPAHYGLPFWCHCALPFWGKRHLATSTFTLCGRHGAHGTGLALVARLGPVWRRGRQGCLCGRRGTCRHRRPFCVAGAALAEFDLDFAR